MDQDLAPDVAPARVKRVPRALTPFTVAAYRRLAAALVLSTFAGGVWVVGIVWEVIRLGGGPGSLSFVTAVGSIAVLIPALLGGVVADRIPQRDILLVVGLIELAAFTSIAVLSVLDVSEVWHLAAASAFIGVGMAFYYPAYSAWLPALVPPEHLMAVNGFEGMVRPLLQQAAGPAAAGFIVAAIAPSAAFGLAAITSAIGTAVLLSVPRTPVRREVADGSSGVAADPTATTSGRGVRVVVRQGLADIGEGFAYMRRTPWLLGTLLFASLMVLVVLGPLEVLIPFRVKDELGGGPDAHAFVLAGFGVGGAVGSMTLASMRMPQRYLTVMNVVWGVACLPFVAIAFATALWQVVLAAFVLGALFSAPMVIWGTLLQRRVPPHLLGRVASLDFFVSLALMPLSMALAGPLGELIGLQTIFVVAGVVPIVVAVAMITAFGMREDETRHPLRDEPAGTP